MKRPALLGIFVVLALAATMLGGATSVHASSLKLAPLEYRTTLKKGEKKKGFIDISNPSPSTVRVRVSVQGFRYIDDKPTMQFFNDEQLSEGIRTDLSSFTLKSRQAVRMYFLVDGLKLPSGDVYAGIFFTTEPTKQANGVNQRIKVGTLLSMVNGTPGARKASITGINVPFVQLGDTIKGTYTLYNPADPKKSTGFYPNVKLKKWPGSGERNETALLLFAGRSRVNDILYENVGFGLHRIELAHGNSSRTAWVFVISKGLALLVGIIAAAALLELSLYRRRKNRRHH